MPTRLQIQAFFILGGVGVKRIRLFHVLGHTVENLVSPDHIGVHGDKHLFVFCNVPDRAVLRKDH